MIGARPTGGAGRAFQRIFDAIQSASDGDPDLLVDLIWVSQGAQMAEREAPSQEKVSSMLLSSLQFRLHYLVNGFRSLFGKSRVSLPMVSRGLLRHLDPQGYDLALFGWMGEEVVSLDELASLKVPFAMRHADMWGLTEGPHYRTSKELAKLYARDHRLSWSRNLLLKKIEALEKAVFFVFPSKWLESEFVGSSLYPLVRTEVIQNPIDHDFWSYQPGARSRLGLNPEARIILFVVPGNVNDPRKGGDLLREFIVKLENHLPGGKEDSEILVVAVGSGDLTLPRGRIAIDKVPKASDEMLRELYSSADLLLAPARLDNSPNVVIEALSCSLPVLAFNTSGLPELVKDGVNGCLIEPFDVVSLADRAWSLLHDDKTRSKLSSGARRIAVERWSYQRIGEQYVSLIKSTAESRK